MGNVNSNVHKAVKAQADHNAYRLYKYVDVSGNGELVDLMRKCMKANNYEEIDKKIMEEIKPFLYNDGNGARIPISELLKLRMSERPPGQRGRKLTGKSGPKPKRNNVLPMMDVIQADECGFYVPTKDDSFYREVCWDIDQRGAAGETILHFCFLNSTTIHYELGKRLLTLFPKMVNDYYLSDEYYGESVLHFAISNEDTSAVKFLLDHGARVHQRCCGNFFSPFDLKESRTDSLEYEWVDVPQETNYEGHLYWGEYPLSFAACCSHEEIARLLLAKGADPNMQDTNGNTVLHILVINAPKLDSLRAGIQLFDLMVNKGGRLDIKNRQGLTPLTLAAKMGRAEMYIHIQELEREVHWKYGNIVSAAYPITDVDTIAPDGTINKNSSLLLAVYGELPAHLNMIVGLLSNLLDEKWNTYVRRRYYVKLILFMIYFVFFVTAFVTRPGKDRSPRWSPQFDSATNTSKNVTMPDSCYLMTVQLPEDYVRFACEVAIIIGSVMYLCAAFRELFYQGLPMFASFMVSTPTRFIHLVSCVLVLMMIPGRATCSHQYEDVVGVLAVLFTAPYFLFFFRAFKLIGPFVVMIFTMITGDLFRFFVIYIIFLIGFSQAMFIVFRQVESSIFHDPVESMMGMFIMSLGEFSDIYEQFDCSIHSILGKALFMVYMVLGALLLVNMLIAMMANTYITINETEKEWLRQWAKIVLVIEQSFSHEERKAQQMRYTQPLRDGRRALLVNQMVSECNAD